MKKINPNDIVGKKFNKLLVLELDHIKPHPNPTKGVFYYYKCQCECGNTTITRRERIIGGETKSCGCINKRTTTHGLSNTRLFRIWSGMKRRCYNPNDKRYKDWGGRGIKICQEWLDSFLNFYKWATSNNYADNLTIDRIDVNGNYCPENCRWVKPNIQANNKRNNRIIEYQGQEYTLQQLSDKYNINRHTLLGRLEANWTLEDALHKTLGFKH